MKKLIIILICYLLSGSGYAQDRVLKTKQPTKSQLVLFIIPLNPNDTIFNSVDFSYLPVKGFPYFTTDDDRPFYTITQRDSIIRKVDELFYEE
jgi:hypothetical protein